MACYMVFYDIADNPARQKVAAALLAAGCYRVQRSVFAGNLTGTVFRDLSAWLAKFHADVLDSDDCILILPCTQRQLNSATALGPPPSDWDMLTDPPNTLIL